MSDPAAEPAGPTETGRSATPGIPHRSIDAGWGPRPITVGEVGVVKPATQPVQIDSSLIDVVKIPEGDPRRPLIGVWEQTSGGNEPDFAHGDYSKSRLTFRTDGIVDVARTYGIGGEVRLNRQLKFTLEGAQLVLSVVPGRESVAVDLPIAAASAGKSSAARRPTAVLPAKLSYDATSESINIGGRTYKRVSKTEQSAQK